MKTNLTTLTLMAATGMMVLPALAAHAHDGTHKMPDGSTMQNHDMHGAGDVSAAAGAPVTAKRQVVATVNGLVCDFCVQSIQKTLLKEPGVTEAHVDLTAKTVTVGLKDGATLEEARLGTLLKDAGYDMVSYKTVQAE